MIVSYKHPVFIIISLFLIFKNITFASEDTDNKFSLIRSGNIGAAHIASGKSTLAYVDDIFAVYWNPAGLREIEDAGSFLSHEFLSKQAKPENNSITDEELLEFSEDKNNGFHLGASGYFLNTGSYDLFLGAAFKDFDGVIGIAANMINLNEEAQSFEDYELGDLNSTGNANSLDTARGGIFYLSYARGFGIVSIGVSGKALNLKLSDYSFYGFSSDVGFQAEVIPYLKIALVFQDLAAFLRPDKEYAEYKKEFNFVKPVAKFGAVFLGLYKCAFSFALTKSWDNGVDFFYGTKYDLIRRLSLYIGLSHHEDLTSGFSVNLEDMKISYSFVFNYDKKDGDHVISMTLIL